ncbi:MAG: T9SS type A sorting domain-containing protein [Ignavibacteriaceae bacterium]|nr:T9SS type A sorting domain-containing protein [Ignavibacteriaceae bacterium]
MNRKLFSTIAVLLFSLAAFGQAKWNYIGEITFSGNDTLYAKPYLCSVDANGRLYVASSKLTTVSAHNAIYYADSSDNQFSLMIDYNLNGDSDSLLGNIGVLRGITTFGTDVIINASVPYPRTKPNTVATMYYYNNADTNTVDRYGFFFNNSGHGTYTNGVAITNDSILFSGVTAGAGVPGPRVRSYNFTNSITATPKGNWMKESDLDPGGAHTGGFDVIRDLALVPNGDYTSPETPIYSSRNSYSSTQITGGVTIWTGGDELNANLYTGTKLQDAIGDLNFDKAIAYGITVDKNGTLWVAGIDSTRRWVKGYQVLVNFAQEVAELPSSNSTSNPDLTGAPMINPCDVAFTADGLTAYVIDGSNNAAYRFKYFDPTGVEENSVVYDFNLNQNYPNPFNPSTMINYSLPREGNVKIVVTNSLGQQVATLVNGYQTAGKHNITFTAGNLSSGIYFYTLTTGSGSISKKMMLIK